MRCIILSSCLFLCIFGCARFYTRVFEVYEKNVLVKGDRYEVYGLECGNYLIYPQLWAYIKSSNADPAKLYPFWTDIFVIDTANFKKPEITNQVYKDLRIDSVRISYQSSGFETWIKQIGTTKLKAGLTGGYSGVIFTFDSLFIAHEIDSIRIVVPIRLKTSNSNESDSCDTLFFQVVRKESSSVGPILD